MKKLIETPSYIHTVNVPLQSMAYCFQSEVVFAHDADILFVHLKFMFLTYGMNVIHNITKNCMYALLKNKKKREQMRLVFYNHL